MNRANATEPRTGVRHSPAELSENVGRLQQQRIRFLALDGSIRVEVLLFVIPAEELLGEKTGILQRPKTFREPGPFRPRYSNRMLSSRSILLGLFSAPLITAQTPPAPPRVEHREA
jgi:hypothetical protein